MLEIGAGTGATTASVLPALAPERTEYVFTDVSPCSSPGRGSSSRRLPLRALAPLDAERDPAARGSPARLDLVVATNVLHATADLRRTLGHVRSLLAPGGLLLLVEGDRPYRWVDITFGLTEGWWRFTDTELPRTIRSCRARRSEALLGECGFAGATAVDLPGASGDPATATGQAVVLAASPGSQRRGGRGSGRREPSGLADLRRQRRRGAAPGGAPRRPGRPWPVTPGAAFASLGEGRWQIDPGSPEDAHRLLGEAWPADGRDLRLVYLWGLDTGGATAADGFRAPWKTGRCAR